MNPSVYAGDVATGHELLFRQLSDAEQSYAFPCDAQGSVDMNCLSERARNDYFYARAVVGNSLSFPLVKPVGKAGQLMRFSHCNAQAPSTRRNKDEHGS